MTRYCTTDIIPFDLCPPGGVACLKFKMARDLIAISEREPVQKSMNVQGRLKCGGKGDGCPPPAFAKKAHTDYQ